MQTAEEIKSAIKNMEYYANKVVQLANTQFDLDMTDYRLGEKMDKDVNVGSVRFNSIGAIVLSCTYIRTYFQNIIRNVDVVLELEKEKKKEDETI